jgi:hypothetical protein
VFDVNFRLRQYEILLSNQLFRFQCVSARLSEWPLPWRVPT